MYILRVSSVSYAIGTREKAKKTLAYSSNRKTNKMSFIGLNLCVATIFFLLFVCSSFVYTFSNFHIFSLVSLLSCLRCSIFRWKCRFVVDIFSLIICSICHRYARKRITEQFNIMIFVLPSLFLMPTKWHFSLNLHKFRNFILYDFHFDWNFPLIGIPGTDFTPFIFVWKRINNMDNSKWENKTEKDGRKNKKNSLIGKQKRVTKARANKKKTFICISLFQQLNMPKAYIKKRKRKRRLLRLSKNMVHRTRFKVFHSLQTIFSLKLITKKPANAKKWTRQIEWRWKSGKIIMKNEKKIELANPK